MPAFPNLTRTTLTTLLRGAVIAGWLALTPWLPAAPEALLGPPPGDGPVVVSAAFHFRDINGIELSMRRYDKNGNSERGNLIDRRCRWLFPLTYFGSILVAVVAAFTFF